jgi:hypothetical protein
MASHARDACVASWASGVVIGIAKGSLDLDDDAPATEDRADAGVEIRDGSPLRMATHPVPTAKDPLRP